MTQNTQEQDNNLSSIKDYLGSQFHQDLDRFEIPNSIDHISENIKLASKQTDMRLIKNIYSNVVKHENQQFARDFVRKQERLKQTIAQLQVDRWDELKQRRQEVIRKWIEAIKLQRVCEIYIKQVAVSQIIQTILQNHSTKVQIKKKKMNQAFMQLLLTVKYRIRIKR